MKLNANAVSGDKMAACDNTDDSADLTEHGVTALSICWRALTRQAILERRRLPEHALPKKKNFHNIQDSKG
jgi:hypothetical protein